MSRLCLGAKTGRLYTTALHGRKMRNLEAKFRLKNLEAARGHALAIGFEERGILIQRDTFFSVPNGKLKLRQQTGCASLIHYRRSDQSELQLSDYAIATISDPDALRAMLAAALGVLAEVRKQRTLMMRRNIRLHLDRVERLGDFGEIEAVLPDDSPPDGYQKEVSAILTALGIVELDLIGVSYFELLKPPI
ncbi:MAG: class IV adenylate cyclase [Candidatus Binataceae bacterium]